MSGRARVWPFAFIEAYRSVPAAAGVIAERERVAASLRGGDRRGRERTDHVRDMSIVGVALPANRQRFTGSGRVLRDRDVCFAPERGGRRPWQSSWPPACGSR